MRIIKAFLFAGASLLVLTGLSGCSPGIPVAYKVTDESVDIAFCDSFEAVSVVIDFGKYPPPFMGSLYSIGVVNGEGLKSSFGGGRPISESMESWNFDGDLEAPDGWERVDFSFFDEWGEFVAGEHLFSADVTSTEWAWTQGLNVIEPQCELNLG